MYIAATTGDYAKQKQNPFVGRRVWNSPRVSGSKIIIIMTHVGVYGAGRSDITRVLYITCPRRRVSGFVCVCKSTTERRSIVWVTRDDDVPPAVESRFEHRENRFSLSCDMVMYWQIFELRVIDTYYD